MRCDAKADAEARAVLGAPRSAHAHRCGIGGVVANGGDSVCAVSVLYLCCVCAGSGVLRLCAVCCLLCRCAVSVCSSVRHLRCCSQRDCAVTVLWLCCGCAVTVLGLDCAVCCACVLCMCATTVCCICVLRDAAFAISMAQIQFRFLWQVTTYVNYGKSAVVRVLHFNHFSRAHRRYATPHARCDMLYLVRVGC